jgi:hypothetical protein
LPYGHIGPPRGPVPNLRRRRYDTMVKEGESLPAQRQRSVRHNPELGQATAEARKAPGRDLTGQADKSAHQHADAPVPPGVSSAMYTRTRANVGSEDGELPGAGRRPVESRSVRSRSQLLGPDSRPVALPDVDYDRSKVRSAGLAILPLHIRWSDPVVQYDLEDPKDLRRVYEQVLREGTPEDIQEFIDIDRLCELWDDLVLPSGVRRRWAFWLRDNRGIFVQC